MIRPVFEDLVEGLIETGEPIDLPVNIVSRCRVTEDVVDSKGRIIATNLTWEEAAALRERLNA